MSAVHKHGTDRAIRRPQGPLEFAQNQVYDIKGILGYISISMVYEWYIMIKCDEY